VPRFSLHNTVGRVLLEDPDGSDLPDVDAAREEALAAARELWASAMLDGKDLSDQLFVIADKHGEHVGVVPFTGALPEGLRQRLRTA
jgi:hypothetical protein